MRNGYTKGLVSCGGNRRIFRPQGDPLSSRVSDCLATPLALASSWKSKGAARRIVKDKGSGLIKPIETHRKRTEQCKYLEHSHTAKQRSPGLCRAKAEAWSLGRSFRARESSRSFLTFLRRPAHIWPTGLRQTLQSSLLPAVRQSVERGPWQPANLAHRRQTILEPTRDFRIARQTSTTDNCDRRRPGKGGDCSAEP